MNVLEFVLEIFIYIVASRMLLRWLDGTLREFLYATLNVAATYRFCLYAQSDHFNAAFAAYLALILVQYLALFLFSEQTDWKPWLAFLTPILFLVAVRYIPLCMEAKPEIVGAEGPGLTWSAYLVGISYMAFRSSHLVLEVRNGIIKKPGLWEYLGFCFFTPTMTLGPINPYSNYRKAFKAERTEIPASDALMRILVGLVKYQFLGNICNRLTYEGFLLNEHPHHWIDLPVAAVFYYLYLYCNFSGFCDMAIGAAGLMGVPVAENFDNPLAARNMKEFWNCWHITLSGYMRDVVFAPLSKYLTRILGPNNVNHAVGITITAVFLLIGTWHGVGWNYFAFGVLQALGVVTVHYYTIGLKKWLGREGFRAYNESWLIRVAAVTGTFCYFAASLFFFANTVPEIKAIYCSLRQ